MGAMQKSSCTRLAGILARTLKSERAAIRRMQGDANLRSSRRAVLEIPLHPPDGLGLVTAAHAHRSRQPTRKRRIANTLTSMQALHSIHVNKHAKATQHSQNAHKHRTCLRTS